MSDRPKIVVNAKVLSYELTGVQRYTRAILDRICPQAERSGFEIEVLRPPLSGAAGHLWEQAILPLRCRNALLFSPSNTGPRLLARQVVTVHDLVFLEQPETLNWKFALWYRTLVPRLARKAAHVITVSQFTKQQLVELADVPAEKVTVIPNGVENRFRPRDDQETATARKALALPCRRYVLTVGSIASHKNLKRLIQAWSRLRENLPPDLWLVIAGCRRKSVYRQLKLQKALPRVHFTGHVADELLPALYNGAEVFAYLSVFEGFGLPALEAMASGVPTVTGNRASLPEVVGDGAITIDPYNVEAVAEAILTLLRDNRKRSELVNKGIERARRFSWDSSAKATWDILATTARKFCD